MGWLWWHHIHTNKGHCHLMPKKNLLTKCHSATELFTIQDMAWITGHSMNKLFWKGSLFRSPLYFVIKTQQSFWPFPIERLLQRALDLESTLAAVWNVRRFRYRIKMNLKGLVTCLNVGGSSGEDFFYGKGGTIRYNIFYMLGNFLM